MPRGRGSGPRPIPERDRGKSRTRTQTQRAIEKKTENSGPEELDRLRGSADRPPTAGPVSGSCAALPHFLVGLGAGFASAAGLSAGPLAGLFVFFSSAFFFLAVSRASPIVRHSFFDRF